MSIANTSSAADNPTPPAKPTTHGNPANLPPALAPLKEESRWVVWKWELKNGKWDKPPYQVASPSRFAKPNDPKTWGTYDQAIAAVGAGQADGIGFMLTSIDNQDFGVCHLAAVDLDHCRDANNGCIDTWAAKQIGADDYVEVTVSGTGLRILGTGKGAALHNKWKIPNGTNGAAIEVYRKATRYITISGAQILGGDELANIDAVLDTAARRYAHKSEVSPISSDKHVNADINKLIKNGVARGNRSEAFSSVVWKLASRGWTADRIVARLALHPTGIAEKYINRLDREVERCYRKWLATHRKQAAADGAPGWPDLTDKGSPKRTYRNAREAVIALGIICSYDEFHDRMLVGGEPINQWAGELSDAVTVILRQMIVDHFDFDPGKDNIADATTELCLQNRFDPIADYFDGLDWDGTPRLDNWLATYLGA
jgi:hypothetical protein